jgi:hypothetical protein
MQYYLAMSLAYRRGEAEGLLFANCFCLPKGDENPVYNRFSKYGAVSSFSDLQVLKKYA